MSRMLLLALTIAAGVGVLGYWRGQQQPADSEWQPKVVVRSLARAENILVSTRAYDRNRDGRPEFAFLGELLTESELPAMRSIPRGLAAVGNAYAGAPDKFSATEP